MDKMFRFNFYKEQYYKEIERRNGLYNSLNIPLTIITALFGLISYMLFNYNFNSPFLLNLLFLCSVTINIGLSIHIVNSFYKVLKYDTIKIFPENDFLNEEYKSVKLQVDNHNKNLIKKLKVNLEEEYENSLCIIQCEINAILIKSNNEKAKEVSFLQLNLFRSFIIAVFSISFYSYNNFIYPKEKNTKIINMSKQEKPQKPTFQVQPSTKPVEVKGEGDKPKQK